jgi:pyruvate/2-oxoglutarate/acetoin dehydrogenase E1 component
MAEQGRVITYTDAGVEALREEMRRDDSIVYIGQGIGPRGGTSGKLVGCGRSLAMSGCGIQEFAS